MIFDIKQQDLRHKARLVVGGNVVDACHLTTYASTAKLISIRIMWVLSKHYNLQMMVADISNAFPNAQCWERVWSRDGPEFGERNGSIITIQKALYGLK